MHATDQDFVINPSNFRVVFALQKFKSCSDALLIRFRFKRLERKVCSIS